MQQIQLRLACPSTLIALRRRQNCHIFHRQRHLRDVLFNQQLRPGVCPVEQLRRRDVAQVPDQARSQQIHKTEYIFFFPGINDGDASLVHQPVIVEFGGGILAPEVQVQVLVEGEGDRFPFFEGGSGGEGGEEGVESRLFVPPTRSFLLYMLQLG